MVNDRITLLANHPGLQFLQKITADQDFGTNVNKANNLSDINEVPGAMPLLDRRGVHVCLINAGFFTRHPDWLFSVALNIPLAFR